MKSKQIVECFEQIEHQIEELNTIMGHIVEEIRNFIKHVEQSQYSLEQENEPDTNMKDMP